MTFCWHKHGLNVSSQKYEDKKLNCPKHVALYFVQWSYFNMLGSLTTFAMWRKEKKTYFGCFCYFIFQGCFWYVDTFSVGRKTVPTSFLVHIVERQCLIQFLIQILKSGWYSKEQLM